MASFESVDQLKLYFGLKLSCIKLLNVHFKVDNWQYGPLGLEGFSAVFAG